MANTVEILMRLRGQKAVQTGMDQTARATTRLDKSVSRTSKSTRTLDKDMKKTSRMGRGLGSMAGVGTAALATVGYAAITLGKSSVQAASTVEEQTSKIGVVLGKEAAKVIKFTEGTADSIGMSRAESSKSVASWAAMFDAMGSTRKESAALSTQYTTLAADVGSFNEASTPQVQEAMQAAFRGEYDALQRYIPAITAAKVQEKALAMTGKSNVDQLSVHDKAMATHKLMLEGTTRAQGDFNRTRDSFANQMKRFKAGIEDVKILVGGALIKAFKFLVKVVMDVVDAFKENKTWAIIVVAVFAAIIGMLIAATAVALVAAAVFAIMWIAALGPIALVVIGIGALAAALVVLYHKVPAVRNALNAVWAVLKNKVWPIVKTVGRIIIAVLVRAFKILWPVIKRVAIILWGVIKILAKIIVWTAKAAAWVGGKLAAAFRIGAGAAKWIVNAVKNVITWLGKVPGKIGKLAGGAWNGIKTAAVNVFNGIKDVIQSVIDKIQSVISAIGDAIDKAGDLLNAVNPLNIGGAASGPLDRAAGVTGQPSFVTSARVPQTKPGKVTALDDKQRNRMRGELVIHNHTHLDGREVAKSVTRHSLTAAARA